MGDPNGTGPLRAPIAKSCAQAQKSCMARRTPLDDLDRKLLDLLQQDASRSLYQLGEAVGLSPSAVQRRLTRYRAGGVIAQQIAVLDPEVMPGTVLACVLITLERESKRHHSSFQERMRAAPNVQPRAPARVCAQHAVTSGMAVRREAGSHIESWSPLFYLFRHDYGKGSHLGASFRARSR